MGTERRLVTRGVSPFMLAYRCWHAGFDYGDAECWQYAWNTLSQAFGPDRARPVLGAIEDFVRCLRAVARNRLDYYPPPCCRMSASERQVLELITALQGGAPEVDELIDGLCGPVTPDSSRLVLAAGRVLAERLLEVGITVEAQRPAPRPGRCSVIRGIAEEQREGEIGATPVRQCVIDTTPVI